LLALEGEELLIRDIGLLQPEIQRLAMSAFGADAHGGLYLMPLTGIDAVTDSSPSAYFPIERLIF
jgi:hypothetical protein